MSVKQLSRKAAGAAVAFGLVAGLAACGTSRGSGSGSGGGAGAGQSGAVVSQAGQGARLSGTYSAEDFWNWVPGNLFPSSITQVPGGEYKTGDVVSPDNKYNLSSLSCADVLQNAGGPGFGEEAYLIDQGQSADGTQFYAYAVYEFASADQASAYVKALAAKYQGCGNFSVQTANGAMNVGLGLGSASETKVPAADVVADLRQSATVNGKKLVSDQVVSADGNVVLFESATSNTGAVPDAVDLDQVSQATLQAFAAAEAKAVADHRPADYTTSTAAPTLPPSDRIGGAR